METINKGEKEIRRIANSLARSKGYGTAMHIQFANVAKAQILSAQSFHYTNKSGDIINFPSAYSKKGFSSMIYHHSYCHVLLPYSVVPWNKI